MLVNRLKYDGRLLPPWYEEAVAALVEHHAHAVNRVFCRTRLAGSGGTQGGRIPLPSDLDPRAVRIPHGGGEVVMDLTPWLASRDCADDAAVAAVLATVAQSLQPPKALASKGSANHPKGCSPCQ